MQGHSSDRVTKGYVLTALTKLAGRLGEEHEDMIENLLQTYSGSLNLELQVWRGAMRREAGVSVRQTMVVECTRKDKPSKELISLGIVMHVAFPVSFAPQPLY